MRRIDISPVVRWNMGTGLIPLMPRGSYSRAFIQDFLGVIKRLRDIPGVTFSPSWIASEPDRFFNTEYYTGVILVPLEFNRMVVC